jgi:hypothetical protein
MKSLGFKITNNNEERRRHIPIKKQILSTYEL